MGFISDVKLLTNLFKTHTAICDIVSELEKESTILKERCVELMENADLLKTELEKINKTTDEIKDKLEFSKQRFNECQSEMYEMHQLESVEYIKTLIFEKGYEIKKLDLSREPFEDFYSLRWSTFCYQKVVILRAIKFKIQEVAAQEGLCYEKLQKALFDINVAWKEVYDKVYDDIKEDDYTTSLLLTSFMMISKKKELVVEAPKRL